MAPRQIPSTFRFELLGCFAILAMTASFMGCGQAADSAGREPVPGDECRVAVVHSDFVSSSVSIIRADGTLCADNLINSGSAAPGLSTALSGDVILPSSPHPDGTLTLIDRFPNGVISSVNADTGEVHSQLSVAPGFASNPQDLLAVTTTRAYVTRAEQNPTPTTSAEDFDEGGDVLIIEAGAGVVVGRIDLGDQASSLEAGPAWPRAGGMVSMGGLVWLPLNNLSEDFSAGGPGVVVAVDPHTDQVVDRLEIEGMKNCVGLAADPQEDGFWGICSGVFGEGPEGQLAASGIFYVSTGGDTPSVAWSLSAAELGGRALGTSLAPVGEGIAYYVVPGDFNDPQVPDQLRWVKRGESQAQDAGLEADAYGLGSLLWDGASSSLLAADASAQGAGVKVLPLRLGEPAGELRTVETNPAVGLPPRSLAFFR